MTTVKASGRRRESRLFAAIAAIALATITALLPGRYQILPKGVPFLVAALLAAPLLALEIAPASVFLQRAERFTVSIVLPFTMCLQLALLALLLRDMAGPHSTLSGLTLLTTSIAIWTTNILVFSLAYWQLDRGGPTGRMNGWQGRADFTFPRGDPGDGFPDDWQPIYADYLFLAFNTSAAFSPTDDLPLTARAKMFMMIQSLISLVTVIAVGARAINILGS